MKTWMIVTLVIVAAAVVAIAVGITVIHNKIKDVSRNLFGTENFFEGVNEQKKAMSETPQSINSMTRVYLPMIKRDFPELDIEAYKSKAQSVLRSYFTAIETQKASALTEECSLALKNTVTGIIEDLYSRNVKQYFDETVIHDLQITRYLKNGATVTIVFEAAVGYLGYQLDKDGKLVFGDKETKKQTRYEIKLVYVQDVDKIEEQGESMGITCPNCGAPIKNLGMKFCEYCGTGIVEVNVRAWKFDSITENTVSRKAY